MTVPRDSIAARLRDLDRIHTPEGIEELEQLDVNGTKQWISIRGPIGKNFSASDSARLGATLTTELLGLRSLADDSFVICDTFCVAKE